MEASEKLHSMEKTDNLGDLTGSKREYPATPCKMWRDLRDCVGIQSSPWICHHSHASYRAELCHQLAPGGRYLQMAGACSANSNVRLRKQFRANDSTLWLGCIPVCPPHTIRGDIDWCLLRKVFLIGNSNNLCVGIAISFS